jgi:hypothetical protein
VQLGTYRDFAQGGQELAEEGQRAPIGTLPVFLMIKVERLTGSAFRGRFDEGPGRKTGTFFTEASAASETYLPWKSGFEKMYFKPSTF